MTELSTMLQSFVDQPVAPPAPIATLIERGRASRRRRLLGVGSSAAVLMVVLASIASTGDEPPRVAIDVTGPSARSAAYLATTPGGYAASGSWRLTIERDGERTVYTSETSPPCGDIGTIRTGDRVFGVIDTPESHVRVGEAVSCGDG